MSSIWADFARLRLALEPAADEVGVRSERLYPGQCVCAACGAQLVGRGWEDLEEGVVERSLELKGDWS